MGDDLAGLPDRCVDPAQTVLPRVIVEVDECLVEKSADRPQIGRVERGGVRGRNVDHAVTLPDGVRE